MYAKYAGLDPKKHFHSKTQHQKHVIIVGAGASGLVAAFELSQSGHKVSDVEKNGQFFLSNFLLNANLLESKLELSYM